MYLEALDHLCLRMHWQLCTVTVYHSYLHFFISYGIIFWGNSSYSPHIFRLQKKAVRIITGSRLRDLCRELFKHLRILQLQSQYILSLLIFVVDNKNLFYLNSEIHSINTRQNFNLQQPQANLTLYQKGAYYSGIKVFNNLQPPPPQHKKLILWC
jgi:hypothetical protein